MSFKHIYLCNIWKPSTSPGQNRHGSDGNVGIFNTHLITKTRASPKDIV